MLFDDPPPQLIGIARLAAASPTLEAKQRVEYLELETRRFIGRASGSRMLFVWTVNPYRGCEFGCKYCYARYAHEFMELRDPNLFERKIDRKSTRLNSSHQIISYAVFCLKKKKKHIRTSPKAMTGHTHLCVPLPDHTSRPTPARAHA